MCKGVLIKKKIRERDLDYWTVWEFDMVSFLEGVKCRVDHSVAKISIEENRIPNFSNKEGTDARRSSSSPSLSSTTKTSKHVVMFHP